jgi:membrane-bound ClpP family serine protease
MLLLTVVLLGLVLASSWLLSAHAGGHVWLVPVPALVLAVVWAVSAAGHRGTTVWLLPATLAAIAVAGVGAGGAALRQARRRPGVPVSPGPHGASGTAVTPLAPVGVVRVAGETWTARSLSGPLPAGAPVHVVRIDGVRLDVWSEAGCVPDHHSLEHPGPGQGGVEPPSRGFMEEQT